MALLKCSSLSVTVFYLDRIILSSFHCAYYNTNAIYFSAGCLVTERLYYSSAVSLPEIFLWDLSFGLKLVYCSSAGTLFFC